MINITTDSTALIITNDNITAFPFEDGKIVVPVNGIAYTIREDTDMVVFRSVINGSVLFTGNIGDIAVNDIVLTRENFSLFNDIAYVQVGGKTIELQEKSFTADKNGSYTITPDEDYGGLSKVDVTVAITSDVSALNFRQIGYSAEIENTLNTTYNEAIDYSKTLYDAWNPANTSANNLYKSDTSLKYFPCIDLSNVTSCSGMCSGSTVEFVPELKTSSCERFYQTFSNCSLLQEVVLLDTSNATSMLSCFEQCTSLKSVTLTDTSKVRTFYNLFWGCGKLESIPDLDTSSCTDFAQMLYNCVGLTALDLSSWNVSNATKMGGLFGGCRNLQYLNVSGWDTSNVTKWVESIYGPFYNCSKLAKVIGSISLKSAASWTYNYWGSSALREITLTDVGANSAATAYTFASMTNWGVESTDAPDARQSLIDSLITYSFDRASAGYATLKLTLSTNTKALLTDDEKAQIEAKGFTIA